MPVHGTIASQFNDPGMNLALQGNHGSACRKDDAALHSTFRITREMSEKIFVIPPDRTRYLSEISENNRAYNTWVEAQVKVADKLFGLTQTIDTLNESDYDDKDRLIKNIQEVLEKEKLNFDPKLGDITKLE